MTPQNLQLLREELARSASLNQLEAKWHRLHGSLQDDLALQRVIRRCDPLDLEAARQEWAVYGLPAPFDFLFENTQGPG